MFETKKANEDVVTSIKGNDLVMICVNGKYHPISFDDLMSAVKGGIQIGGRNLLKCSFSQRSANSSISGGAVTFNSNADSYTQIPYADPSQIIPGEEYTVSFDVSGIKDGNSWGVYLNGSTSKSPMIQMKNGRNHATFIFEESSSRDFFMLDDSTRSFPNGFTPITISNIKLERGNIATDYTPAPEDIASGLWGGNWLFTNYLQFGEERRCA